MFAAQASRKAVVPRILLRETQKQRRSLRLQTFASTLTSCWTNLHPPPRTGATIFFSCPCPIHSGSGSETSYQRFTARRRTSPVRRRFAATRRPLSRVDLLKPRSLPARGRRTRIHSPSAGTLSKRVKPVPAFVVALCPAPPVSTQTSPPLPCSEPRRTPVRSYLRATPRLGFWNTEETCSPAPEVPLPAATVLPSLAMTSVQPITFLEGVTPRALHRMSRAPAWA